MGFFRTDNTKIIQDKNEAKYNDYLWYMTNKNKYLTKEKNQEQFCLFSLVDNKIIYTKDVELRAEVDNIIFDEPNTNVYIVDK